MNEFFKFQKISDRSGDYNLSKKDSKLFNSNTKWVGTEKIHGSNFSIYLMNNEVKFAKRNSFLGPDEWFCNYQVIKEKLIKNVKDLSQILKSPNIIVYGELFGGYYPENPNSWVGPLNTRINDKGVCIVPFGVRAIQEGIYYSPNIEYMMFDIAIVKDNKELEFVDYYTMENCAKQVGMLYSKALIIGTFESVQKFNIKFDSKVPEILGLEKLPQGTNTAEGIVIKPVQNYLLDSSNTRCMIKIKNKEFLEISDTIDLDKISKNYEFVLTNMINSNRLNAVISKIGRLTESNKEEILDSFVDDVWTDYYKSYSDVVIKDIGLAEQIVKTGCNNLINLNL